MTEAQRSTTNAYWPSVFIGAYGGAILQIIAASWGGPIDLSELWLAPVLVLVYGMLAVPFVAFGLVLFGLTVSAVIHRWAQDWWVGPFAALWGGVAGKLMFYGIDHLMFFGYYDLLQISLSDMGIFYGVPTGIAWWVLRRRELACS